MTPEELEVQKRLVNTFLELETEIKLNRKNTVNLGWGVRNELITHIYSNYNNHEKLNDKREEQEKSRVKGNVLKWIYELLRKNRDLYGYFENPDEIIKEMESTLTAAVRLEDYEISSELNLWLNKMKK